MFEEVRKIELDDGRTLTVIYQGERYLWAAYVAGEPSKPWPDTEPTPAAAMAAYLGWADDEIPVWARELSEGWLRELREAPRYACECCGYRTLLSTGHYEICPVCRWEDDPTTIFDPDEPGGPGPNYISLTEGRANFEATGTSDHRGRVGEGERDPLPEEYPPAGRGRAAAE